MNPITYERSGPTHVMIWVWLVLLLVGGLAVFSLPLAKEAATVLVFGIAAVKAFLVGRHYMHLHGQPPVLYALIAVPVLLATAFALALLPDIGFR